MLTNLNVLLRLARPIVQTALPQHTNLHQIVSGLADITTIALQQQRNSAISNQTRRRTRIERLPTHAFKQEGRSDCIYVVNESGICEEQKLHHSNTSNEQCAICVSEYQSDEIITTLPCNHEFHKNCVDPWLLEKGLCPICRFEIF